MILTLEPCPYCGKAMLISRVPVGDQHSGCWKLWHDETNIALCKGGNIHLPLFAKVEDLLSAWNKVCVELVRDTDVVKDCCKTCIYKRQWSHCSSASYKEPFRSEFAKSNDCQFYLKEEVENK